MGCGILFVIRFLLLYSRKYNLILKKIRIEKYFGDIRENKVKWVDVMFEMLSIE